MRKGRVLFCIFLIAVAAYAIHSALGWSFKTRLFPISVSIPLLALATIQLLQVIFGKGETDEGAGLDLDFSSDVPPDVARHRVINTFCWILGFIICVYLVGFPLTVPLFIFFYLKFQSNVSWLHSLAATAITWGIFYALFQWLVHIQFEPGAIQTWLDL
jgi:hypothetical protein